MNTLYRLLLLLIMSSTKIYAQSSVIELFGGNNKATLVILFLQYFKNQENINSKFLFFSRARVTDEYKAFETTESPQFALTEAISYNIKSLKGFAPVMVLQLFNNGIYPKLGIQYLKVKPKLLIFGWLVSELRLEPTVDLFLLIRFTPSISRSWNLYTQLELVNNFPTSSTHLLSFAQRVRLGLKKINYNLVLPWIFRR